MSLDIKDHNYESVDEPEQAQIHSIYYHLNQVAAIQRKLNTDVPSRKICVDCDRPIPEKRRELVKGCQRCVECQEEYDNYENRR